MQVPRPLAPVLTRPRAPAIRNDSVTSPCRSRSQRPQPGLSPRKRRLPGAALAQQRVGTPLALLADCRSMVRNASLHHRVGASPSLDTVSRPVRGHESCAALLMTFAIIIYNYSPIFYTRRACPSYGCSETIRCRLTHLLRTHEPRCPNKMLHKNKKTI